MRYHKANVKSQETSARFNFAANHVVLVFRKGGDDLAWAEELAEISMSPEEARGLAECLGQFARLAEERAEKVLAQKPKA